MSNDNGRPTLIERDSIEGVRIQVKVDREVKTALGLNYVDLCDMTLRERSNYGQLFVDSLIEAGVDCLWAKREQATKAAAMCREYEEHQLAATWDEIGRGMLN